MTSTEDPRYNTTPSDQQRLRGLMLAHNTLSAHGEVLPILFGAVTWAPLGLPYVFPRWAELLHLLDSIVEAHAGR